jgi:hypothetical protein
MARTASMAVALRVSREEASARKQYQRDREWITSASEEPFSFRWACEHLGLSPERVRAVYLSERELKKIYLPITVLPGCKSRVG